MIFCSHTCSLTVVIPIPKATISVNEVTVMDIPALCTALAILSGISKLLCCLVTWSRHCKKNVTPYKNL